VTLPEAAPPLLIAQLTDTHVVAPGSDQDQHVDNNARLAAAVRRINAESPTMTAVVATGDMTNWGHPAEYEMLAALLEPLSAPVLPIPGNHDDRDLMRQTFADVPWADAEHASWVTLIDGLRVVGLDSIIPGQPGAAFDDSREQWLRAVLGSAHDGPTLLALHHPPFPTGIGWMDRSGFVGLERLSAVLGEFPVDRVMCGHMHRPISSTIADIPAHVGISTVQHVELGLGADAPIELILDPVGYQILRVEGSAVVVHTRYIETGEVPFTPPWAAEFE
jgi:3',5'-cyclic AMP phosphodiesterase CpdA